MLACLINITHLSSNIRVSTTHALLPTKKQQNAETLNANQSDSIRNFTFLFVVTSLNTYLFPNMVHLFVKFGLDLPSPLEATAHWLTPPFSSGNANRYRLTLPASLPSSHANLVLLLPGGRIQSGTILKKNPRTPFDAASIAAYSRRLVESDVQY